MTQARGLMNMHQAQRSGSKREAKTTCGPTQVARSREYSNKSSSSKVYYVWGGRETVGDCSCARRDADQQSATEQSRGRFGLTKAQLSGSNRAASG